MAFISTSESDYKSQIDDAFLMELLDESPNVEESVEMHDDEDRLRRVIQSLEAEITVTNIDRVTADDVIDRTGDTCSFDWMEGVAESEAPVGIDTFGWYLEDGEMMRDYDASFFMCYNGEECVIEHDEYCSLWE